MAQEVLELLKKLVGLEVFSKAYTELQREAAEVKYSRKRKKALEVSSTTFRISKLAAENCCAWQYTHASWQYLSFFWRAVCALIMLGQGMCF